MGNIQKFLGNMQEAQAIEKKEAQDKTLRAAEKRLTHPKPHLTAR